MIHHLLDFWVVFIFLSEKSFGSQLQNMLYGFTSVGKTNLSTLGKTGKLIKKSIQMFDKWLTNRGEIILSLQSCFKFRVLFNFSSKFSQLLVSLYADHV